MYKKSIHRKICVYFFKNTLRTRIELKFAVNRFFIHLFTDNTLCSFAVYPKYTFKYIKYVLFSMDMSEREHARQLLEIKQRHIDENTQINRAQKDDIAQARQSKNEALRQFQEQHKRGLNETSTKFKIPDAGIYDDEQDRIEHELYRTQTLFDLLNKRRIQMQEMEISQLQADYERSKTRLFPRANNNMLGPAEQKFRDQLDETELHYRDENTQILRVQQEKIELARQSKKELARQSKNEALRRYNDEQYDIEYELYKMQKQFDSLNKERIKMQEIEIFRLKADYKRSKDPSSVESVEASLRPKVTRDATQTTGIPSGQPKIPQQAHNPAGSAPKSVPRANPGSVPGVANRRALDLPNLVLTDADVRSIKHLIALTDKWTEFNMENLGRPDADHLNFSISNYGPATFSMISFHTNLSACIGAILKMREAQLLDVKKQKLTRILRYDGNCWMNLVQTFNPRTYMQTRRYHIYSEKYKDDVNLHIDDELEEIRRAQLVLDGLTPAFN